MNNFLESKMKNIIFAPTKRQIDINLYTQL